MKQHEREYFISQIRSGITNVTKNDISVRVLNPTIEQEWESCLVFEKSYTDSYRNDVMSQDEMLEWMIEHGVWSQEQDGKAEGLKKDIDRLKVEIFNARNNRGLADNIRLYLRAGEEQLIELLSQKFEYNHQTREGMANAEKDQWLIECCTFKDGKLFNFVDISVPYILSSYKESQLDHSDIRELARTEPWRSLWMTRKDSECNLFLNTKDRTQNIDQRQIVIWSQMYDNIQESLDCPTQDVIEDDDMLDGWFIIQGKKRDKERAEGEFEQSTKSDKIKNSDEVFVMTGSDRDVSRIDSMNDIGSHMVKKQREALIKRKGGDSVSQGEFSDEKLKLQRSSNQQYKSKFGG